MAVPLRLLWWTSDLKLFEAFYIGLIQGQHNQNVFNVITRAWDLPLNSSMPVGTEDGYRMLGYLYNALTHPLIESIHPQMPAPVQADLKALHHPTYIVGKPVGLWTPSLLFRGTLNLPEAILFKQWLPQPQIMFEWCQHLETQLYPFGLKQNRLLWACGDPGTSHGFRGVNVTLHPWPPELETLRDQLTRIFEIRTNFCLVNHYRNGLDSIAPHVDGDLYADRQAVFTISLGTTRRMRLVSLKGNPDITFDVDAGDLFIMWGTFQQHWKHGIDKQPDITTARYSLTFRSTRV
jgi:hypothetical protein